MIAFAMRILVGVGLMLVTVQDAHAALTTCKLSFTLTGWSAFYKTAKGSGTITCDNGQKARVAIATKGGGFTFGQEQIEGRGTFSPVANIRDIFGAYAAAEAHAGAGHSSGAQVVTKGAVSLAFSGTGEGVDIGFSFGKLTIKRKR